MEVKVGKKKIKPAAGAIYNRELFLKTFKVLDQESTVSHVVEQFFSPSSGVPKPSIEARHF